MTSAFLEDKEETANAVEDGLDQYLKMIRQYPLLTQEQELELAKACAQGDEDAVRMMVNSNLRLVVSIARDFAQKGVPLLDLIQEGSIGLIIAARKYDHTRKTRFSTYATKWIRQRVSRAVLKHAGLIRVPTHTLERMRKILAVKAALKNENGEEPTALEIAAVCEEKETKVQELLDLVPYIYSLDTPIGDNEDAALQELIEDLQAPQPQEELVRRELKQTMDMLLEQLTPRQKQVLRLRFGMEDGTCYSLQQIGSSLGISKERARQLEQDALEKLRKLGVSFGLEDFLA